jgi:hypothetical protein
LDKEQFYEALVLYFRGGAFRYGSPLGPAIQQRFAEGVEFREWDVIEWRLF